MFLESPFLPVVDPTCFASTQVFFVVSPSSLLQTLFWPMLSPNSCCFKHLSPTKPSKNHPDFLRPGQMPCICCTSRGIWWPSMPASTRWPVWPSGRKRCNCYGTWKRRCKEPPGMDISQWGWPLLIWKYMEGNWLDDIGDPYIYCMEGNIW